MENAPAYFRAWPGDAEVAVALTFGLSMDDQVFLLSRIRERYAALILDATLVLMLLVPAVMRLVGDANWWAPGPLRRFYARHGIREDDGPAPGAVEKPAPEPVSI